jgi:hypothetical protein
MIVHLVLILLIVIMLCNSITYSTINKCPNQDISIRYIRASRLPGKNYQERVGLDTINLKLDRDVPCGVYSLTNMFGYGVLFVSSSNPKFGYLSMKDLTVLDDINIFDMWDLKRLESPNNGFIQTYNRGCCS